MNYNHTTRETMAYVQEMNRDVSHKVMLLMDIYHSFLEDYQIGAAFVRSGELCGHVHFRDSNGGSSRHGHYRLQGSDLHP